MGAGLDIVLGRTAVRFGERCRLGVNGCVADLVFTSPYLSNIHDSTETLLQSVIVISGCWIQSN